MLSRSGGVRWDGRTLGPWAAALDGADALINLAGRSVDCRYTPANRREIMDSRLESTARAARGDPAGATSRRGCWLQSSTATIYADTYGPPNAEDGELGGNEPGCRTPGASRSTSRARWEEAAAGTPVRTVLMRSAMVMSPDRGGVFDTLRTLVRRGLGGRAGERAPVRLLDPRRRLRRRDPAADRARGPLRPGQPRRAEPAALRASSWRALRAAEGVPFGLPATKWMLEAGRVRDAHRDRAGAQSRAASCPARLLDAGFAFSFPEWPEAARDLAARRRAS